MNLAEVKSILDHAKQNENGSLTFPGEVVKALQWTVNQLEGNPPSLRDQFAMAVATGFIAAHSSPDDLIPPVNKVAAYAYQCADEMLKVRDQQSEAEVQS